MNLPGIEVTIEELIRECEEHLHPLDQWGKRCHAASLHLVRADNLLPVARVARGVCEGIGGQHSWVVLGWDCYDREATLIDPTLWSYDYSVEGVWTGTIEAGRHHPHGDQSIWEWGRPLDPTGPILELEPRTPFSERALRFLDILGPLDEVGWRQLAHAPVRGWPSDEILPAIEDTFGGEWVPIDIIGMVTDRNPSGLYLRDADAR